MRVSGPRAGQGAASPLTNEEIRARYEGITRVTPAGEVIDHQLKLRADLRHPVMQARLRALMGYFARDAKAAGGSRGMAAAMNMLFYPATTPGELAGLFNKELFCARTYQVTADMVDAVTATYRQSAGTIGHLEEDEIPFEAGFAWLDKPFLMTDRWGRLIASRAVTWSTQPILWPGRPKTDAFGRPDGSYPPTPGTGIRITCWHHAGDIDGYTGRDDDPAPPSGLIVGHTQLLPIGQRFGSGHPKGDYATTPDDFAHWMHVLWCFMEMEITTLREAPLPRPARRRARGLKHPPQAVNIITLRRSASFGPQEAEHHHRAVDWSCRWVVQGHLRHVQSYQGANHKAVRDGADPGRCAICDMRITWVKAHLRGPEDLPLRATPQLYRLNR